MNRKDLVVTTNDIMEGRIKTILRDIQEETKKTGNKKSQAVIILEALQFYRQRIDLATLGCTVSEAIEQEGKWKR